MCVCGKHKSIFIGLLVKSLLFSFLFCAAPDSRPKMRDVFYSIQIYSAYTIGWKLMENQWVWLNSIFLLLVIFIIEEVSVINIFVIELAFLNNFTEIIFSEFYLLRLWGSNKQPPNVCVVEGHNATAAAAAAAAIQIGETTGRRSSFLSNLMGIYETYPSIRVARI